MGITVFLLIFLFIIIWAYLVVKMLYDKGPKDEKVCQKLREMGWNEKQIREFMGEFNGRYHPPKGK